MNLESLKDDVLIGKTETLVRQERELLTDVLRHLREIERRRLFSAMGYKSTFDFAVRRLGYPEDQAYRRIAAMRLMFEIPELEAKITAGEISLSHIGLAQTLFRQQKKASQTEVPTDAKLEVLTQISNKSVREAERILLELSPSPELARPDRIELISHSHIEVKFVANHALIEKIERLKGMLAHKSPNVSLGELFETLCDIGLKELGPTKIAASRKRCVKKPRRPRIAENTSAAPVIVHHRDLTTGRMKPNASRVSTTTRREVFDRAGNQCENCGSVYALEIDHIRPVSRGGLSTLANLRVLCRSCNQRAAIQNLGFKKMDRYINGSSGPRSRTRSSLGPELRSEARSETRSETEFVTAGQEIGPGSQSG